MKILFVALLLTVSSIASASLSKLAINKPIVALGVLGNQAGSMLDKETYLRVQTFSVGGSNAVEVQAKLSSAPSWTVLATLTGVTSQLIDVSSYDEVRFVETVLNGLVADSKFVASGFYFSPANTSVGTVSTLSVATANGFSGVVANATSTPAVTIDVAALDAAKIGNGLVSSTEFSYLDGVTSAIETQFGLKAPLEAPALNLAVLALPRIASLSTAAINAYATPVVGMLVYDSTLGQLKIYASPNAWKLISTP